MVLDLVFVFVLTGRSSPASRSHVVVPFRLASASRPRVTGVAAKIADLVVIFFRVDEEVREKMWRRYLFPHCAKKK